MSAARVMINAPPNAKAGELLEIKAMIAHPMDTGYAVTAKGEIISRHIINRFVCTYDDEQVFAADFYPAIAANPFLSFFIVATKTGTLTFAWTDDKGVTETSVTQLAVT
jgi:sulfur-oxidizing protein SoxZ